MTRPKLRKLYHLADWSVINKDILNGIREQSGITCTNNAGLLTHCINEALKKHVPIREVHPRKGSKPWFDDDCHNAYRLKEDAYKKFCAAPCESNWLHFRKSSNRCNNALKRAKADHQFKSRSLFQELKAKPGAWWYALKAATGKGDRAGTPTLLYGNRIWTDPRDKANILSERFVAITSEIHQKQDRSTVPIIQHCVPNNNFDVSPPTLMEVQQRIESLEKKKAAGPDAIGAIPLIKGIKSISPSLHNIIATAWNNSVFPADWKKAFVVPVPKSKPSPDPDSYRPISLVPLMSKIGEECMAERLLSFLSDNDIISKAQYGFKKGSSSLAPLLLISQRAADVMDEGNSYCLVSLDFKRAFDSVWHRGLLAKLSAIGLPASIVSWFASYLNRRSFQVVVEGASSRCHMLKGGVPQGSVLGPTLFSIFINDLLPSLKCDHFCFADDLAIAANLSVTNAHQMSKVIQDDLNTIVDWAAKWLLPLNPSKCSFMLFSSLTTTPDIKLFVEGKGLDRVMSTSYLGITLTSSLSWAPHIGVIRSRAKKQLGALMYSRPYLSYEAALTFYKAYVRANLEYCSPLWAGAPKSVISDCDSIQERAYKVLNRSEADCCSLQPLHTRRLVGGLTYLHAIIHGRAPSTLQSICPRFVNPTIHTRLASQGMRLDIPRSRTNRHMASFMPYYARMWNSLPFEVRGLSDQQSFKRAVNKFLTHSSL